MPVDEDMTLQTTGTESQADDRGQADDGGRGMGMGYGRFAAMIATSTVVMFALMYLNTYAWEHVWWWSETRTWMAVLMGATMAVIMLGYMWSMYPNRRANRLIIVGSVLVFAASLFIVRSQVTVNDRDYMKAMIPHHSIAILTSTRAGIDDIRVQQLADEIVRAQRREIREMEWLVEDIAENGIAETVDEAEQRPVPEFEVEHPVEGSPLDD